MMRTIIDGVQPGVFFGQQIFQPFMYFAHQLFREIPPGHACLIGDQNRQNAGAIQPSDGRGGAGQ
jgi:hypothetical protein